MGLGQAEGEANIPVDLGEPDNAAQAHSGPVMARHARHSFVSRSLQIHEGSARRSRRALPDMARPPFLESIFGNQSNVNAKMGGSPRLAWPTARGEGRAEG